MNHAQLGLIVLDDLFFYLTLYSSLVILYLLIYRKIYWGIFDPMIWTVISMSGGAFCVMFLYFNDALGSVYKWSFVTTEVALLSGLIISKYLPHIRIAHLFPPEKLDEHTLGINEFNIFTWVVGIIYIMCEVTSFMVIGIVILEDDVTHLSAFADHGVLMAFITSFRLLCPLVLFYKKLIRKEKYNYFDILCWTFAGLGILTTGSKSAVLIFVFLYFIVQAPLIFQGKAKPLKFSLPAVIALVSFPVIVVSISSGAETSTAIQAVFLRLLSSGDVFLLGYNDSAMASVTEKSFFNYAFYPGWGTILKNLGFNFSPPEAIGSDILNYHYGRTDGGPNSRYNYVALHFFGFWGAILYSLFVGIYVGTVRNSFKTLNPHSINYFGYLFITLIVFLSNNLIDDINIFSNYNFWRLFFLSFCCLLAKLLYHIMKYRVTTISSQCS